MRNLTKTEQSVLHLIRGRTEESPITGREIIAAFNIIDDEAKKKGSNLRKLINDLRIEGYPICASGDGYYYPKTRRELARYVASLRGRADAIYAAVDGMVRFADKIPE